MQTNLSRAQSEPTDGSAAGAVDFFSRIGTVKEGENAGDTNPGNWRVSGFVKQELNYAVKDQDDAFPFSRDSEGIRQFRSTFNVALKGSLSGSGNYEIGANIFYDAFYHHSGDAIVTDDEYENMADEAEWREVYANVEPVDDVWVKFGRQIVAWGESDFTQILDLVNPRDEREFGLVDLENARLPIWATRISYVGSRWGADLVLTHEFEANRWAGAQSDFDPLIGLRENVNVIGAAEPDVDLDDPGYLGRIFLSFPRGDISFIYGNVHDRVPALRMVSGENADALLIYPDIEALGFAANWVSGFWLLKAELARKKNMLVPRSDWPDQFAAGPDQGRLYDEKTVFQLLAGLEYSGYQDVQMSVEWVVNKIDGHEAFLAQREEESFLSSRINFEFLRDTANLEIVWARWVEGESDSIRTAFSYDLSDTVKLSFGYIDFSADKDGFLYPYRNNDRLFGGVRYSF
jgi:hypothetical protein